MERFGTEEEEYMELYMVRHGQTDWNKNRLLQGRSDTVLNEKGRNDARKLREELVDIPFTKIYTSPLKRAYETACLATTGRDIPLTEEERITEISFGEYEGLSYRGEGSNVPDPQFHNFFDAPHLYQAPPGGESIGQLLARTGEFLNECCSVEAEDAVILISTHGAAMSALLSHIEGRSLKSFWGKGVPGNCELVHVKKEDRGYRIL